MSIDRKLEQEHLIACDNNAPMLSHFTSVAIPKRQRMYLCSRKNEIHSRTRPLPEHPWPNHNNVCVPRVLLAERMISGAYRAPYPLNPSKSRRALCPPTEIRPYLCISPAYPRLILGLSWAYPGVRRTSAFLLYSRLILGLSWAYPGLILGLS